MKILTLLDLKFSRECELRLCSSELLLIHAAFWFFSVSEKMLHPSTGLYKLSRFLSMAFVES
jgi:hypothetical protein